MAYMTVSHRTEPFAKRHRSSANHRGFRFVEIWTKIAYPFRVVGLLFEMVAHPDRFSLNDDKS